MTDRRYMYRGYRAVHEADGDTQWKHPSRPMNTLDAQKVDGKVREVIKDRVEVRDSRGRGDLSSSNTPTITSRMFPYP